MDGKEEVNSLEQMQNRLYDPKAQLASVAPHLAERPGERTTGWEKLRTLHQGVSTETQLMSGPARFFVVALVFFLLTAGGAVAYLVWGGRSVSTNNVNMAAQGPTSIASGDTVPLLIAIENRNPVPIRNAKLTIDFPESTKEPDSQKPLTLYIEDIGDIEPGGKAEKTIRASIFGSENQRVSLPIKLEYHTDTSSATFVKNKQFDFTITSSPISLEVSSISQVSAGQPVTVDVLVKSNATTPLENVAITAEYPFGFNFTSASPQPTGTNKTLYVIGKLAPGEQKRIELHGTISGENNDDRVFKFNAGTLANADALTLATTFTTKDTKVKLTKPFIATTLAINHDSSDSPVIEAGVPVQAIVTWTNTLSTPINNPEISVALTGGALDPTTMPTNGFYRSNDTTILFNGTTNAALKTLEPGESGQGTFTFRTKSPAILATLRNPNIDINVSVSGQRLSESNVPQAINGTITRTVKVGTNFSLTSRVLYSSGPFKNTGPIPPKVNQPTTYTIVYSLNNSGSSVAGAKVSAALPTYVRYTGSTNPNDGSVTYNDVTRTVTWDAGDVTVGGSGVKSAAFQVELTPSASQSRSYVNLISAQQVTGVDRYTGRQITGSVPALTTEATTDPNYQVGFGQVQ